MNYEINQLINFFKKFNKVIITCSGGVDSLLLLKIADLSNINFICFTANTPSIKKKDVNFIKSFCITNNYIFHFEDYAELTDNNYTKNDQNRCFFCKTMLYKKTVEFKNKNNYDSIFNGTNVDDLSDIRPGIKAGKNHGIVSPYIELKITKEKIRKIAKFLNLEFWNKPEEACLASRIPTGLVVDENKLKMIEESELFMNSLGIRNVRVRHHGDLARIQIYKKDYNLVTKNSNLIDTHLKKIGFKFSCLDLNEPPKIK